MYGFATDWLEDNASPADWPSAGGEEGIVGGMTMGLPRFETPLLMESETITNKPG